MTIFFYLEGYGPERTQLQLPAYAWEPLWVFTCSLAAGEVGELVAGGLLNEGARVEAPLADLLAARLAVALEDGRVVALVRGLGAAAPDPLFALRIGDAQTFLAFLRASPGGFAIW